MRNHNLLAFALLVAVSVTLSGMVAYAGDCCASGTKTCPIAGAKADKPACTKDCAVSVSAKVELKTEKVDGKDMQVPYLNISAVKGAKDKPVCDIKGASIKVTGDKTAEVEKLAGKEVDAEGVCKAGKEFDVKSIAEKPGKPS